MENGESYLYNDSTNVLTRLPNDRNNMTEEECSKEFGRRLRRIMLIKGVSQLELSELTEISRVLLSRYMNGKSNPGFYNIDKIARALDCSVDEFRYL